MYKVSYMARPARPLFPATQRRAEALGERLRLARLRRRTTLDDMATRVGTTRSTLGRLERGDLSVSLALLARVLGVLGLEADLDQIAVDDEVGRRLQDVRLRRPRTVRRSQDDG
jgi:transcriptional regulator with XRE-family HTH domain